MPCCHWGPAVCDWWARCALGSGPSDVDASSEVTGSASSSAIPLLQSSATRLNNGCRSYMRVRLHHRCHCLNSGVQSRSDRSTHDSLKDNILHDRASLQPLHHATLYFKQYTMQLHRTSIASCSKSGSCFIVPSCRPQVARTRPFHQNTRHQNTSTNTSAANDTSTSPAIENLNTDYCNDFECTSSPAVEQTVRSLAQDIIRAKYSKRYYQPDVQYQVRSGNLCNGAA